MSFIIASQKDFDLISGTVGKIESSADVHCNCSCQCANCGVRCGCTGYCDIGNCRCRYSPELPENSSVLNDFFAI